MFLLFPEVAMTLETEQRGHWAWKFWAIFDPEFCSLRTFFTLPQGKKDIYFGEKIRKNTYSGKTWELTELKEMGKNQALGGTVTQARVGSLSRREK